MKPVGKIEAPALWAVTLGPVVTFLGYTIAAMMWPGFDGMVHTISDLAANDSPVQLFMSSIFIFSAVCDVVVSHYAKALATAGRLVILLAAISTVGLTVFTTPSQTGHSIPHRIFAIASFVLFTIWPLFAMRKGEDVPPLLRPKAAIAGTVFLAIVCVWFLSLWIDKSSQIMGLGERIGVGIQGLYPIIVLWHSWLWQRKRK